MSALLGQLLGAVDVSVRARPSWVAAVEETGDTLEANARLKAKFVCEAVGAAALSDDTGLMVDALDGAPGVRSARFAGEHATDADNRRLLLDRLRDVPAAERAARFETVVVLWLPDGSNYAGVGSVRGRIGNHEVGDEGFGYDSLFVPAEGDGRTFAQMSAEEKNDISHRARAIADLVSRHAVAHLLS